MKIVRLIKMCLNEMYSKVRIGKHWSDNFPLENGLKQGDALSSLLFNFAYVSEECGSSAFRAEEQSMLATCFMLDSCFASHILQP
jgi:hypothetical protein